MKGACPWCLMGRKDGSGRVICEMGYEGSGQKHLGLEDCHFDFRLHFICRVK